MKTAILAWVFFLLTGFFIALVMPLGEGFDEPWHLGYVQYLTDTLHLPPGPQLALSVELQTFLKKHPVGWKLHEIFPDLQTEDDYWQESDRQRHIDDATLRQLRFANTYQAGPVGYRNQYESHQPPLYYILCAPLMFVASRLFPAVDVFLLLRLWSVLLASTVVPLTFILVQTITKSENFAAPVTMLVALFPGIYPDVVRVSNDALAVPVAAAVFIAIARYTHQASTRHAKLLGICLLAGLCTKAFFIPVFIAIILAMICTVHFQSALITAAISAPGWIWYVRNAWITGSLTGLPETVAAKTSVASSIAAAQSLDWIGAIKLAMVSHIWMGNWSLLQYRSWMYEIVVIMFVLGLLGFLVRMDEAPSRTLGHLAMVYGTFLASLFYYATQVFQETGLPVIQGWYLSPFICIEAMFFVFGVSFLVPRPIYAGSVRFAGLCFLLLVIYGNAFIAAPYYSGQTFHTTAGQLHTYHPHWNDLFTISWRLVHLHPWIPGFLPALLAIVVIVVGFMTLWSAGIMKRRTIHQSDTLARAQY